MSESLTKPCLSFIYLYQTTEIRNITKKKKEEKHKNEHIHQYNFIYRQQIVRKHSCHKKIGQGKNVVNSVKIFLSFSLIIVQTFIAVIPTLFLPPKIFGTLGVPLGWRRGLC